MRWKSSQPALAKPVTPDGARLMPAPPRWLLAVPDAVRQLEKLDRDLLTRRDVERLFGVSRARAAQLMPMFGAELAGSSRVLRRAELLRQLKKMRGRAAFRIEEQRRARVVGELHQARLTGIIRVAVPVASLEARLAGLPEGVTVAAGPDRGAVRGGDVIALQEGFSSVTVRWLVITNWMLYVQHGAAHPEVCCRIGDEPDG